MAAKRTTTRRYWLFKSEPETFSFDDLMRSKHRRTHWDGVRNFQARNLLRDDMQVGDGVLFYHSSVEPMVIAGIARIVKAGHPDPTACDPDSPHFDPKSSADAPTWYMVEIEAEQAITPPLTRDQLKAEKALADMVLLQRGSRLSVQPVTAAEWAHILRMAGFSEE